MAGFFNYYIIIIIIIIIIIKMWSSSDIYVVKTIGMKNHSVQVKIKTHAYI